jgi:hypothetical protein
MWFHATEETMNKLLGVTLALGLLVATLSRSAAGGDAARTIVDRAIQAHGGDALRKTRSMIQTARGEITTLGAAVPAMREMTLQLPDQCRWSFVLEVGGKDAKEKVAVQLAINGDKGWRSNGGAVKELAKLELDEQRDRAYCDWLMTLLPLKDVATELTALPEIKVGEAPAVGVKVVRKNRPEVKLYFDAKTHLLVKLERKAKDAGQDALFECFLSEVSAYDGVKLPAKSLETLGGKKVAEWTLTSCKFPELFEESAFAKP